MGSHLDSWKITEPVFHHYDRGFGQEKESHLMLQVISQSVLRVGSLSSAEKGFQFPVPVEQILV